MHVYSAFWLSGAVLSPVWRDRPDAPDVESMGFPTANELTAFANAPIAERQAVEFAGYGFVLSTADSEDRHRVANKHYKERQRAAQSQKGATTQ